MLRAIAAIAHGKGENLADPRAGLACLEVFALGGPSAGGTAADRGYFAVRTRFARGLLEGAELVVDEGALSKGAPLLVRFLGQIVPSFGLVVSEKVAAQSMAIVGALGGAAINLAFVEHFQNIAHGHFTIRRLQRVYGANVVRSEYDRLKSSDAAA